MSATPEIRVGYLIDIIGESPGGTETQLVSVIRHLDRRCFAPELYVLRNSDLIDKSICPFYEMQVTSLLRPSTICKGHSLAALWRRHRLDIVHTHFRESNQLGVLLARAAGVGAVITTRRNQGHYRTKPELLSQKALNRLTSLIIANSRDTMRWTMKTEGVPEEKIRVVYNAIDVDRFWRVADDVRSRYRVEIGVAPSAPVVGIVANLRPVKALDTFVRAAAIVAEALPAARFLVIGEGDEDREDLRLLELCSDLNLSERLQFLGRRKDIPELLSTMNVGVLSSRSESMPNAVGEYMAAGLPVVSTDVGGVSELVEDGVNGYVVPVGDSRSMAERILQVLANPGAFPRAANARKIRELCDPGRIARQYEEIYRSVVA